MELQQADPASGAERNHFTDEWNVTGQGGIRQLVKQYGVKLEVKSA